MINKRSSNEPLIAETSRELKYRKSYPKIMTFLLFIIGVFFGILAARNTQNTENEVIKSLKVEQQSIYWIY
jgi:hypothetical protein